MRILLGLLLVVLAALAVRWLIAARGQRNLGRAEDNGMMGPHLPLRPSGQVFRALRAAEPTRLRDPQRPPEPGTGPLLRP